MNKYIIAAAVAAAGFGSAAFADGHGVTVGVSWSNFQEERWKTDEAAIRAALEAAGATYISADAQSSSAKQLSDVESLIAQGADALIILAQDAAAIGPAVDAADAEGIPVVAYDRLIEDNRAFYLTFDNVEVGRMQAGGVVAALTAQGMEGLAVSGQDGDHAALNRVALGTQTVSVWKDARELGRAAGEIAAALAGDDMAMVEGSDKWTSPGGTEMNSMFLAPVPITADNLSVVTDAGWITVESLCQGVTDGPAPCN